MAKGIWGLLQKAGLVEEVPDESGGEKKSSDTKEESASEKTATAPAAPKESAEDRARIAEIDSMVREQLANAMAESGAKLVEELGDLLDTLGSSIPDEKLRYSTAIKILLKKGGSVSAICNDVDRCIGVLEQKDREFNSTLKDQFDTRVGGKAQVVSSCVEQITTKQAQIESLQTEIASLAIKKNEAETGIGEEKEKLEQVQERFQIAYQAMRSAIEAQRAKITQYGEEA